jgi:hypothetical protein
VESADGEAGVVQVQDKGRGVETRAPKPGEVYEENDAEIVKRPDDQEVDDRGEVHDDTRGQVHVDKVTAGGDSHDVAAGVDDHAHNAHDDAGGQVNVDKIIVGRDGHDNIAAGVNHVRVRGQGAHAQDEARAAGGGDHDGVEGDGISEYTVGKEMKLQEQMQPVYKRRSGGP